MIFFRLSLCAAALSFSSCSLSTVPEPAEFKLSAESLSQQYPTWRETEAGRLYAGKILITRDEEGRRSYLASGGAILITAAEPPIQALAPSISVTPVFAEAQGKATVKKNDRLYIGEDESTKIRIEGMEIKPEGPHGVRGIADTESKPPAGTGSPETVDLTLALTPTFGAAPPPAPDPQPASEEVTLKPKSATKPKVKRSNPAKPAPAVVKVGSRPVTPTPKAREAPALDRTRLLNLMREPSER